MEYLLKNGIAQTHPSLALPPYQYPADILDSLVRLSENDRPSGIQAEVLRAVQNMVVLLDEQFLVHSAVHRAVLKLLRNCVGDDIQEQLDGKGRVMGAARNAVRSLPSEYEGDCSYPNFRRFLLYAEPSLNLTVVNLLCILCSRIRTFRELLIIFFHDKHWYHSEPLFSGEDEEDEDEEEIKTQEMGCSPAFDSIATDDSGSLTPTSSRGNVVSPPASSAARKPEYEFLLFNYLLRFVHREGNIGDLARAGLLFLMDVAMSPGEQIHRIAGDETHNASARTAPTDPISDAALALAEYILDGDFSDVLGAGLSAVYSLLPRKLEFLPPSREEYGTGTGMMLGQKGHETEEEKERWESERQKALALGVEEANGEDFRSRLDHFLKLLEFIQDIFKRNDARESADPSLVGTAIIQSILDAVRRVFLENILYPSILESSDADGSAVAVMSYIETMIRTLSDGQLNDLLVDFLVSEDNDDVSHGRLPKSHFRGLDKLGTKIAKLDKTKKRKSSAMVLLEMEVPDSRKKSDYFTSMGRFTLKDLILINLRSESQQTATCALQLLHTMLVRHPQLCMDKLLLITHDPNATSFPHPPMASALYDHGENDKHRFSEDSDNDETYVIPVFMQPESTFMTHQREMELYLALVSRVDPSHEGDVFSTGYDRYLRDAILEIQSQPAYQLTGDDDADLEFRRGIKHRLNVNDPIFTLLLESTRTFFSNAPEMNLALSGVLATLAMHPDRSLAGWLTFGNSDVSTYQTFGLSSTPDPQQHNDDRSIDYEIEEKLYNDEIHLPASRMDENSRPVIHSIFHGLVTQLDKYRQMVVGFDKYLVERRQGLLFSENLTDALNIALDIGDESVVTSTAIGTSSKPKSNSIVSAQASLVSFLSPRRSKPVKSSNPSESDAPSKGADNKNASASPFWDHYESTSQVTLEPFIAPAPSSGPWTFGKSIKWNVEEEEAFNSTSWGDRSSESFNPNLRDNNSLELEMQERHITKLKLSQLLDNVVILEESIKEFVSIIHARRSLGIDSIRYI